MLRIFTIYIFALSALISVLESQAQDKNLNAVQLYSFADSLYKAGNEDLARDTLFILFPNFNQINNDTLESKILALFGHLQKNIGNDTVSINHYMRSLSKKQVANYLDAIKAMGHYFYERENYTKSLNYFRKLLLFSRNVNNRKVEAEANLHLGEVFLTMKHTDKAKSYFNVALEYAKKTNNSHMIILIYNHLGQIGKSELQIDTAIYFYKKTIELAKHNLSDENQIIANSNLSKIMEEKGNYAEAITYLSRAVKLAESKNIKHLAQLYYELAELYTNTNNPTEAKKYYHQSYLASKKSNNTQPGIQSGKKLGELYLKKGNYKLSAKYFHEAIILNDSLMKINSLNELAKYEAQYSLMQKEQEIALLDRDKKFNKIKLSNEQFKSRAFIIGLIVLILLVVVLLFHISSRIKRNKILSSQNEKINEQNEELNQINQQLSDSEHKLIQALSVKNKLFTIIGHDLKSPLMDIRNLIFILKSNALQFSESDLRKHTSQIENRLTSLLELLNNLLNWGMAEKQSLKYTPEKISINQLFTKTLDLFEGQILSKGLIIKDHVSPNLSWTTDHNMLEFSIRNILSNAIKFSKNNSEIMIETIKTNKQLKIIIEDQGIGMSNEELSKIFIQTSDKVRRGTNNEKGTGLGMALAQEFATQMNGKLQIESETNKGTKVTLVLPENGQKV